ncbi:MAG: aminotransferase class I/II-fold pyridoxal phosphate-dependent enzyme, partial [Planctomycetia bacterium]|nr:aminotransferase class I/II-fold pyridoxal phosphate-dependent enzyme [Planctomycetia bacterium]
AGLKDPVKLTMGQPDYDVPEEVKQKATEAIRAGHNRYTVTQGIPELRNKIADVLRKEFGKFDSSVLITCGVSAGIFLGLMATVDDGEEVLVPDPYFVEYKHLINLIGAKPVYVDTYPDFRLRGEALEAAVTPRTRVMLINSPSNPTGAICSRDEIQAAVDVARRHDLLIISDEIYRHFSYDGPAPSVWPEYEKTLLLRGFSKTYGMTGWRLGYATGPEPIIQAMTTLQQYSFVNAPTPLQWAAITALDVDVSGYIAEYKARRDIVCDGLSEAFEIQKPGGAFYVFPRAPGGSGTEFVKRALEQNMLIIPGNVFSEQDTHFRISYATSRDNIQRGIDILLRLAKQLGKG